MIDFWLAAGVLLLAALAFLLLPLLRPPAVLEEDRQALNVSLYQERLAALAEQHAAGTLTADQLQAGQAEAGRELLHDTERRGEPVSAGAGRWAPLAAAVLVPLIGLGLYLHWGASDKLELAREFAVPPQSLEELTQRLERAVTVQPDSAEAWYFLGRAYMSQERSDEAARSFSRAVHIAGRQPELLGQWAQALYFAQGKQWNADIQALVDEALKGDPQEGTSLGLLGIHAFQDGRFADAIAYWQRLVDSLPEGDPSRAGIQSGIQRARAQLGDAAPPEQRAATLRIEVALADALKDKVQPGDSVFVFARALSGPPMPLAVKRLTVADLPAEVTLSDADAMMPQLRLSAFPSVQLVARVSRAGNATAGEWVGRSKPVRVGDAGAQTLAIDSVDGQP
jgi:cytochrome c-type biogenesis protein CcmH